MIRYTLVTAGLALAALVVLFACRTKRIKTSRGRGLVVAVAVLIVFLLAVVEMLFPIENLFMTFTSLEQAYAYVCPQNTKNVVVEGESSTLVMGVNKENNTEYQVFPKVKNGWKRVGLRQIQFYHFNPAERISITLVRYKPSGDCYAFVHFLRNQDCEITDERGSRFQLDEAQTGDDMFREYYAYVGQPSATYTITINGVDYPLTGLP